MKKPKPTIGNMFGQAVRARRLRKNLSQEALADLIPMNRTYVGDIENSRKAISLEMAYKISVALEVPLSRLIKEAERFG